uniref:Uncharacterized protein n=1 Tax=Ditylenchus dipsaci TaxID=166011 RepID=A0A915EX19_9BILA
MRTQLFDSLAEVDFANFRLRDALKLTEENVLHLFVSLGLIKNKKKCQECGRDMHVVKRSKLLDGIWVKECAEHV